MDIKNFIRVGEISSIHPSRCSVRVTFADKDGLVSAELPVLNRGSAEVKDYWLPSVGEQALCLFLPNGKNLTQGFLLGTYFSSVDAPNADDQKIRRIDFGDGTCVAYDRGTHALTVHCTGAVDINAASGDVVVNGISLVNHTHPGCQGGSTGKPG